MKKYKLGQLTVIDKGLLDTKDEIVVEMIDRMQKYVAEGQAVFEDPESPKEQKLIQIESLSGRFCGLSEFLQLTMGIEIRLEDEVLYTQKMFNNFFAWESQLKLQLKDEAMAC